MKSNTRIYFVLLILVFSQAANAQEEEKSYARPAFESQLLIENQSVVIPTKNTLEWDIQHRFGAVGNGYEDLFGLYAPSNIRMGFTYSAHERLNLGVGLTKLNHTLDLNAKVLILRQTSDFKMPISLAYYGNMAIDQRSDDILELDKSVHRLSFFHELIAASRITYKLSLQAAVVVSHFNAVDSSLNNTMLGYNFGGRYKVGGTSSIIFDVTIPALRHDGYDSNNVLLVDVQPGFSFGYEISTTSHAFQVFISNYYGILPQQNLHYNTRKFNGDGILIGFNITRLWNF